MTDTSAYQTIIYRSWLDEAHTKPCYEAHVLFRSFGWSVIGQGSTPNRAEKEAREMLTSCIDDAVEDGHPVPPPFGDGDRAMLTGDSGTLDLDIQEAASGVL